MVKTLSKIERQELDRHLAALKEKTGVAFAALVVPASDMYFLFIWACIFFVSAAVEAALLYAGISQNLPYTLMTTAGLAVIAFLPPVRYILIGFIPRVLRYHEAAKSAVLAFHAVKHDVPPEYPVVLLYVSLAERYVHILHSRRLNKTVPPSAWEDHVKIFTAAMKTSGVAAACRETLAGLSAILAKR